MQQIEFEFDVLGNLIKRHNTGGNTGGGSGNDVEESFCYDDLNRLVATVTGGALCSASNPDITYDSHGNITHKAGVGNRKLPRQVHNSKLEFSAIFNRASSGVRSPSESCGLSSLYSSIHQ